MYRRNFILTVLGSAIFTQSAFASQRRLEVYKSPTCGCCSKWVKHMRSAGFTVDARDVDQATLWSLKTRSGITSELGSCHTAFIGRYFVEGHVPAADVQRLLSEQPDALGLTVPGMPIGSPGMEMGDRIDPYDTLLVLRNGKTQIFEWHG